MTSIGPSSVGHGSTGRCSAAHNPGEEGALPPINGIIGDLASKQAQLSALINRCLESAPEPDVGDLVRLLRIHGQNASRLGRLLRDRRALSGDAADGLLGAIAQALDELSTEWGVDL
jgi:hypothetical protein